MSKPTMSTVPPTSPPSSETSASETSAKTDRSLSLLWANLLSIALIVPVGIVGAAPFYLLWGETAMNAGSDALFGNLWVFMGALVGGIGAHEAIHGLTWQVAAEEGSPAEAGSTAEGGSPVEYGIKWKTLTPYAHLKRPVTARAYRWGTAMPGLALGAVPLMASYVTGSGGLFWFGLVFTWVASGDAMILWMIRGVSPDTVVEDHPERAGCWVVQEEPGAAARSEDPAGGE